MNSEHRIAWIRLDRSGTDQCRLRREGDGWSLEGNAEAPGAYALDYRVQCDADWRTLRAEVSGKANGRATRFHLERGGDAGWIVNGAPVPRLAGGRDIDLGFTPATNTIAINRLALAPGTEAPSVAVWLDERDWQTKPLRQIYCRITETTYRYISPDNDFAADLIVDAAGFVLDYPGLWRAEGIPERSLR